jgi:EAL domain-containing protein (putative c-di-GMP-specific phosphodiesterase class I)
MGAVTDLVLSKALDDAVRWQFAGIDVPVAVNLFAPCAADLNLPAKIGRALAVRRLDASALTVEITEDLFLDNIGRTQRVLHQLRERGIRVAIDDFGNGYSALSYLRDLPIDEVKLDRHFIAPILVDPRAAAVVRAVVNLAHVLGLTTVAEGVEDAETAARLREYGCDVAQGFYYSPPVSSAELLEIIQSAQAIPSQTLAPASARSS